MPLQTPAKTYDEAFKVARIPFIHRKGSLKTTEGLMVLDRYMNSEAYSEDVDNGFGYEITGPLSIRLPALPLMARASVVKDDDVYYVTLIEMLMYLKGEGYDHLEPIKDVHALFVANMFEDGEPLPYTFYDRAIIENFLTRRTERGLRNHYSTVRGIEFCGTWWTASFMAQQKLRLRTLSV